MKDGRLTIRLPVDLVVDIKELARRKGVTLTALTEDLFRALLLRDRKEQQNEDVEQL